MQKRIVTEDKIVTVETTVTETDRVVDYADILDSVCVEIDDWHNEAPWEACDGWEHDAAEIPQYDYEDRGDYSDRRGYVSAGNGWRGRIITIDDDTITEQWGINGYHGCSKQVRAELIASAKRVALDQLVKWYRDGWQWYTTCCDYEGYTAACGGIDCFEYADGDMRHQIADEIAGQMEDDDFVVTGRPVTQHTWSRAESYRINRKYRQESYIVKTA